jgi:RNase P subunit RPR2
MNKVTWLNDKKLRCKNCKYFTLKFKAYDTKFHFRVECLNCGAVFHYSDRDLISKIRSFQENKESGLSSHN